VFVQPMIYEIVKKRPADPPAYAAKWLQDYISIFYFIIAKRSAKTVDSASDYSDEEIPFDNARL